MRAALARVRARRTAVLTTAGLGLLTAAAWSLALPAGLAVGGLCCLLLDWLLDDG